MYLTVLIIDMCIGRHAYRPSEQFKVFALNVMTFNEWISKYGSS